LAEAIQSVVAQSVSPLEIIVVDDGSTDDTAAVARDFGHPVHYYRQANSGPAAARNRGLKAASGKLIAFLDDDDLWTADKLELQVPRLLDHADHDVVLGHTQRMLKKAMAEGGACFMPYRKPVRLLSLGSALFRRSVFRKVGTFDERMRYGEDDDWFMRAESQGINLVFLPEVTQYYRFHEDNMTHDKGARRPFLLRLLKNRLNRERTNPDRS
jgi:glycosyltransferase involved in cell wall biosynthesis